MAAGPVVLVSYEDDPATIAHMQTRIPKSASAADRLHIWPDPPPLWTAGDDAESGRCEDWPRLWAAIRQTGARLVVIDPASAALADVSTTEPGPVRAFMRALAAEAAPDPVACWAGCGVLVVAHNNKSGRNALLRGEDPGADAVAGSAVWYDAPRGVLALYDDPLTDGDRIVECIKANRGRRRWGARIRERRDDAGRFAGLELDRPLTPDTLREWKADVRARLEAERKEAGGRANRNDAGTASAAGKSGPGLIP